MINHSRRKLLLGLGGAIATCASGNVAALMPTPRQTAGPFYPATLPLDDDSDLTRVAGKTDQAAGTICDLGGSILDINGKPLPDMRIEIWQCDANGRYRHPRETASRPLDENFQGHGLTHTNNDGRYSFRTIRPVPYPGRTPHIHIAVFPDGESPFVTQLYIAGEARNESDFLYSRIPEHKRHMVIAEFKPSDTTGSEQQAAFNIILNRASGTPQDT